MMKNFEDVQKANQKTIDATVRNMTEVNKGFQTLANEMSDFTKKSFEDGTSTVEQLMGVRSFEQALEIQADFVRKSYDGAFAQATKVGEIYADMSRDAFKSMEKAAKKGK